LFRTNGLEIQILFLDTKTKPAPKADTVPAENLLSEKGKPRKKKGHGMEYVRKLRDDEKVPGIMCGIDMGERYPAGLTTKGEGLVNSNGDKVIRIQTIKKKAINEPLYAFQDWLEKAKSDEIREAEAETPHRLAGESVRDHWFRWQRRNKKLDLFYNSKGYRAKHWDYERAQRGEFNRAIDGILRTVNGRIHLKYVGNDPPLFILGDASFSSENSVHTTFEKYFYAKVIHTKYFDNNLTLKGPLTWIPCLVH